MVKTIKKGNGNKDIDAMDNCLKREINSGNEKTLEAEK